MEKVLNREYMIEVLNELVDECCKDIFVNQNVSDKYNRTMCALTFEKYCTQIIQESMPRVGVYTREGLRDILLSQLDVLEYYNKLKQRYGVRVEELTVADLEDSYRKLTDLFVVLAEILFWED